MGKEKYTTLEKNLKKEMTKGKIINGHMSLATNLELNLFNRFFEISKELIEVQRLLLNSNSI
ncbi:hypothetical protein [Confluentibacter citreus]|uniref:hypothetical protein n=1 Tax=Confluentibacter citreus TaxID=2007307 RepID=UPI0012FD55FA|nr:hypothetical protein [Confluentibacter citreus]